MNTASKKYYLGLREDAKMKADVERMSARAFTGTPEQTCSHFGCGRTLTITEQLFGNKCISHSKIEPCSKSLVGCQGG